LLKFNFESRQLYVINEALLDKRLLFDSVIRNRKQIINTVTDLEACYDRQLPNIGRIIKESISIDRKGIKLIIKVLPIIEHHICAAFRISKRSYGGEFDPHASIG